MGLHQRLRAVGFAFACLLFAGGAAADTEIRALLDLDHDPATGCPVATANGTFPGVEAVVVTTVSGIAPSRVLGVARRLCVNGALQNDPSFADGGGWYAGDALGDHAFSVVETYMPLDQPMSLPVAVGVSTQDLATGAEDDLVTADGSADGPSAIVTPAAIPALGPIALALLSALLAGLTLRGVRRGGLGSAGLAVVALVSVGIGIAWAAIVRDGNPSDWPPDARIAADRSGAGGGPSGPIASIWALMENGNLELRFDVGFEVNHPPVGTPRSFSVAERSPNGTVVGSVDASDADPGQQLTYAITAGNAGGAFTIDAASGVITVADGSRLDFETLAQYSLTVSVTDNGAQPAHAGVLVGIALTDVNEAPVLTGGPFSIAEDAVDGAGVGSVSVSDPDAGQSHSYAISAGNTGNAFAIDSATGLISVADAGQLDFETTSAYTLTVAVSDSGTPPLSGTLDVDVALADANDAPVPSSGPFTLPENSAAGTTVGSVAISDDDTGQTHTFAITGGNTAGAFAIDATSGVITVADTGALDFETTPSFSLSVEATDDGTPPASGSTTVVIALSDVDELPAAADDTVTVGEDSGSNTLDVLANDSDPEGAMLTITAVGAAGNGTSGFTATHATYLPDADFCGSDSFSYTISDDALVAGSVSATVNVAVTCVDDAPVAVDDAATVAEDAAATPVAVLANDTDVDGGAMAIVSASDPAHGTVVIAGGGLGLTYEPDADWCGSEGFSYSLAPGGSSATVSMTVTCSNDLPVAQADAYTTDEDVPLSVTAPGVLTNDADVDGPSLRVAAFSNPSAQGGSVTVNADGSFGYTPPADYFGSDSFSYTVNDGTADGNSITVSLTVAAVNDAPQLTLPGAGAVYDGVNPASIDAAATLTDVDSADFSGGSLSADISVACDADDRLGIAHQGSDPGQIGVAGSDVSYAGLTIGSFVQNNDCADGVPSLVVTFTSADATPEAAEALVRALRFHSVAGTPPTAQRTVSVTVDDGDGDSANATRTVDLDQAPAFASSTPANGAADVTVNANVALTFDEAVTPSGAWFELACSVSGTRAVTDTVVTGGPTDFTVNPNADFANGEACTMTLFAAGISDDDTVDPPDNPTSDASFSFTIVDVAPTVTASSPSGTVADDPAVSFSFSEAVDIDTAAISFLCDAASVPFTAGPATGVTDLTLTPDGALPGGAACTVTLPATAVSDGDAVDPPDNLAADAVVNFTVDAAPGLTGNAPADSATMVALASAVQLTFSESVNFSGAASTLVCGGTPVAYTVSGSPGTSITLTPVGDLPSGVSCSVTVAAGDVSDADAVDPPNALPADASFGFTTVDVAPRVASVTPVDGADPVASNTAITLTFSESVTTAGNWAGLTCSASGARDVDAGTLAVSGSGNSRTLTPSTALTAGETCTLTLDSGQITDVDGIAPSQLDGDGNLDVTDGDVDNFVSAFTVDLGPSFLQLTAEVGNSATVVGAGILINVDPDTNLVMGFSEPVGLSTAPTLVCAGSPVAMTATPSGNSITLDPTPATLAPGEVCTLTVSAGSVVDDDNADPPDNLAADVVKSFEVAPVPAADSETATPHLEITVAAPGVLANDTLGSATLSGFGDSPATANANAPGTANVASANGGLVQLNADGSYTYNPPAGFTGSDGFYYTVTAPNGSSRAAQVTITVENEPLVWFVDNTAPGPIYNGTARYPFADLAGAGGNDFASNAADGVGDFIFIDNGGGSHYTCGLTLLDGQTLVGDGDAQDLVGIVSGLTPAVSTTAGLLPIPSGTDPILDTASGSCIVAAQDNSVRGLTLGDAPLFALDATAGGTLTVIDATIDNTAGGALRVSGATASMQFTSLSSVGGTNAVTLTNTAGTIAAPSGALSGASGTTFLVSGGTAVVTYGGSITQNTAASAVAVSSKTGGSINFGGLISANTTSAPAINLTNNTGAAINFTGRLGITTTSGAAFAATGGGAVTATDPTSVLGTSSGTALNVSNTSIGAGGLKFTSISSNGATSGIVLSNTGSSGGLTVSGSGAAASGGTLQNTSGDAIALSNTRDVSLSHMRILSAGGSWIDATSVTNLTLTAMDADASVDHGFRGNGVTNLVIAGGSFHRGGYTNGACNYNGFDITNLLGTSSVTSATFTRSNTIQFRVNNALTSANPDTLTVTGTTWDLHDGPCHGDHLSVNADAGGQFKLVTNDNAGINDFTTGGSGVQATAGGGAGTVQAYLTDLKTSNNTAGAVMAASGSGNIRFNVLNNTSGNGTGFADTGSVALILACTTDGTCDGAFDGNSVDHSAGNATNATQVVLEGNGTGRVTVSNNTVSGDFQRGLHAQSRAGTGSLALHATGNSLTATDAFGLQMMNLEVGASGGGTTNALCLNLANNTAAPSGGMSAYRLVHRAGYTYQLQNLAQANTTTSTDVQTWVASTKSNLGTPISVTVGGTFSQSAGCSVPTLPSP